MLITARKRKALAALSSAMTRSATKIQESRSALTATCPTPCSARKRAKAPFASSMFAAGVAMRACQTATAAWKSLRALEAAISTASRASTARARRAS